MNRPVAPGWKGSNLLFAGPWPNKLTEFHFAELLVGFYMTDSFKGVLYPCSGKERFALGKNHRFWNIAFSCIFLNSRCSTKNLFRQAAAECILYHSIHFQLALGGQEAESGWGVDLWDLNFSLGRNQSRSKWEIGFHVDFIGFQRCQLQIQIVKAEFTPRSMCVMNDDK